MPKKARIMLELTYELPVEKGYVIPGKGVTHDPDEMLDIDIDFTRECGWIEFINVVEPDIKTFSFEVVD